MKKLSSYQKLKKRILDLESDIYHLVEEENKLKTLEIKTKWRFVISKRKAFWFGRMVPTGRGMLGLMGLINKRNKAEL